MLVFHRKFHYFIVVFLCFLFWAKSNGDIPLDAEGEWNLFGRFRLRVEQDSDNVPLIPDRTRIRLGNFAGIRFTPDDHWELVVRGRAGDKRNSRTIDSTIYVDNGFSYGQRGFILDQYFANYTIDDYARITIGRAAMPFWSNTEKLWDQDLTPIGGALVAKLNSSSNPLELAIGSFHMPDGLNHFHACGSIALGTRGAHVEWLSAFSSYATTSFGWLQKSNVRVHDIRMDYSISDKWKLTGRVSPAKKIIGTRESTRYRIDMSRPF